MLSDPASGQSQGQSADGNEGAAPSGVGAGGAGQPASDSGWFDALPDGLKAEPSLAAFKGKPLSAVVESHVSAQKMIGNSLRVPGKDATPEEVAKFTNDAYTRLGRPATPDAYAVKLPAVDGVQFKDEHVKAFLSTAHKLGLNNQQAEELIKYQADFMASQAPNYAAAQESCMKALVEGDDTTPGWGSTADRYINTAKRTLETMFTPDVVKQVVESGLGNNAGFVRGLARMGRELIEDGLIIGEEKGPTSDGAGLLAELEKMMGDAKGPYFDRNHAGHDAAIERAMDIRRYLGAPVGT